jgi:MFS family permease
VYSVITIEFPTKREEFIGYCQSACGIGLMTGPVLGSMIYGSLGYEKTFFVFSGILLFSCIIVFFILPPRLNKLDEQLAEAAANDDEKASQAASEKQVSFKMFIFNFRAMLATVSSMIAMIFMLFYNGILAVELSKMGVDTDNVGMLTFNTLTTCF